MKVLRAYKTELDSNNAQRTAFRRHAGAARWAFNWGLGRKIESYRTTGKSPSAIDLHRELNGLKRLPIEDGGVPWMYEVSKCAPQEALRNLDNAYRNFFRRCKKKEKRKGFPRFKSRKRGIGSFRLTGSIRATDTHVKLPRIGYVRLKERGYLPEASRQDVNVLSVVVSERAGRWFVSMQVEQDVAEQVPAVDHVVGVDVGSRRLATTSDGLAFENPRPLRTAEKRTRLYQKSVSRKAQGSSNRRKAVAKLARQHCRVACIRRDSIHKITSAIIKSASVVVVESLNVRGMVANRSLSKSISDAALAEIHRQIVYKAERHGVRVVRADRWFASSKTCSGCGKIDSDLGFKSRYVCSRCGIEIDRDRNAAINLRNLAVSSTVSACCPGSSGLGHVAQTKLLVGQEPNVIEVPRGIDG